MGAERGSNRDSDALLELAQILRAHADGTPEREEHLKKLAAQIRAGSYHVDSHELARKILDEEEALRLPRTEPDKEQ
jgi:anti-sigma28 factor (negative regulator of flagellin synthesis)